MVARLLFIRRLPGFWRMLFWSCRTLFFASLLRNLLIGNWISKAPDREGFTDPAQEHLLRDCL